MKKTALENILESRLIVIIRGVPIERIESVGDALYRGGVRALEVTFAADGSTSDEQTAQKIKLLSQKYDGKMSVGAGTVLTPEQVELAASAGAEFIVSPDVNADVIKKTKSLSLASVPGAFTASEAMTAHRAGADIIKLFPAGAVSSEYLSAITAPLSHLKYFVVGGVTKQNLPEFLSKGACGAGISSGIVSKKAVEEENYAQIEQNARDFLEILKK